MIYHDFMKIDLPEAVKNIVGRLEESGYTAYLVGGSLRDLLLGGLPKDWDIATDARPEEIQKIFEDSVYENSFGTVGVKVVKSEKLKVKSEGKKEETEIVEVTTFRKDGKYSDNRHPDEVVFTDKIEEDLARRDFTVNAMALKITDGKRQVTDDLVDPFGGQKDLEKKIIRAVGEPAQRLEEDALRLMRAVRFAAQLGFTMEEKTRAAVKEKAVGLRSIAAERIRDELIKIIMTDRPTGAIQDLEELGLLALVLPELREGIGCGQNKHHIYTVFEHNLRALQYAADKNYSLEVRLASLLHDVGKPRTKGGDGPDSTFYSHEVVGAKMTRQIMERLKFSGETAERVIHLVRQHLFYYNVDEVTAAGVRRFLRRVGPENIDDLIKVREADRIGSGVPKAVPYKLRHLLFMIEKVKHDPLHPKMLKLNGDELMAVLRLSPGPRVGRILGILLEEVLDEPEKNTKEFLEKRAGELNALGDADLEKLAEKAKERKDEAEAGLENEMKKKYYVK